MGSKLVKNFKKDRGPKNISLPILRKKSPEAHQYAPPTPTTKDTRDVDSDVISNAATYISIKSLESSKLNNNTITDSCFITVPLTFKPGMVIRRRQASRQAFRYRPPSMFMECIQNGLYGASLNITRPKRRGGLRKSLPKRNSKSGVNRLGTHSIPTAKTANSITD
jgi:hypothetical protein